MTTLAEIEAELSTLTPEDVEALRALLPDDGTEGEWDHDIEPPRPMGRVLDVEWDDRSDQYAPRRLGELHSVRYERAAKCWDQGDVGACTGFAIGGLVMTTPVYDGVPKLRAKQCFNIYSRATSVDAYRGTWPPTDTGSDGNSAARAARDLGYIRSWSNGRTVEDLNTLLQQGAVAVGWPWYSSFNEPDSLGRIHLAANAVVIGGHEFDIVGWSIENDMYDAANSWGTLWGVAGYFQIPGAIVRRMYTEGADCTQVYD